MRASEIGDSHECAAMTIMKVVRMISESDAIFLDPEPSLDAKLH